VLASGDPGFFGILRALRAITGPERLEVHPAPSSVAVAFARLGVPWDDAMVVSAHGRDPAIAIATALRHPKVAILTEPRSPATTIIAGLAGSDRCITVAERLGTPMEALHSGTADELAGTGFAEPNVVVSLAPGVEGGGRVTGWPPRTPTRWALPDAAFEYRAGMITKAEVRAVALAAVGPGTGDLVWDVGCGSGSVAVECARLGAAVHAIDNDPAAIELTVRNAAAHRVPVRTVAGTAPDVLHGLPDPDAVFVGGGGTDLIAILDAAAPRVRRAVVVAVAIVERIGPVLEALAARGLAVDATTVQANRVLPIAGGHRLAATNPITIIRGGRP
jgi:precorrin-6Y C5,15-methyltransferase (decarboxylating)